jgi:hypothetical protein
MYEETSSEEPEGTEVDGVMGFETSSTQVRLQLRKMRNMSLCIHTEMTRTIQEQDQSLEQQVAEDQETTHDGWATYQSPLESYPLLRWNSQIAVDAAISSSGFAGSSPSHLTTPTNQDQSSTESSSGSMSSSTPDWLDMKVLKTFIACKGFDTDRRICQYEVPGGGECRDAQCEDVHISRASVMEPGGTHIVFSPSIAYLDIILTLLSSFACMDFLHLLSTILVCR